MIILMTWKQEHKGYLQDYYGGYCIMCEKLNVKKEPYCNSTVWLPLHDEYKKKLKEMKK